MAIGSRFSYYTNEYEFNYITIDPEEVMTSLGGSGVEETLPGNVLDDIKQMGMPYGLYVNPYTGYIYGTDAGSFAAAGLLYQWSPEGELLGKHKVYINPAHFLALQPDEQPNGIVQTVNPQSQVSMLFNMQGQRIAVPQHGRLYVRDGKKFIAK